MFLNVMYLHWHIFSLNLSYFCKQIIYLLQHELANKVYIQPHKYCISIHYISIQTFHCFHFSQITLFSLQWPFSEAFSYSLENSLLFYDFTTKLLSFLPFSFYVLHHIALLSTFHLLEHFCLSTIFNALSVSAPLPFSLYHITICHLTSYFLLPSHHKPLLL